MSPARRQIGLWVGALLSTIGVLDVGMAAARAQVGACCNSATGACTEELEAVCEGQGNSFQGAGVPCMVCDSGPNESDPCSQHGDCWECVSGGTPGAPCDGDEDCDGGTCSTSAQCVALPACAVQACCETATVVCVDVSGTDKTCQGELGAGWISRGLGTDCFHNCCEQQYTGADSCQNVVMHVINVPPPGGDPVTVTITGHNGAATPDDPQWCDVFPPEIGELGWWEGFQIDDCADVRIDLCCTDINGQPMIPAWGNLVRDCPCGELLQNGSVDPPCGTGGLPPWAFPWLYCDEDNLWQTFGPLQAGSYYYPIYTAPDGTSGVPPGATYQMHITVCPCPAPVCCTEDTCQGLNAFDCADAGGYWLGPPNVSVPVESCAGDPCATGSCCTAPGVCVDEIAPGQPMDRATCETTFGGDYVGGALCDDTGDPCPLCEIKSIGNCQLIGPADYTVTLSDLSAPGGPVARADDFMPLGDTIHTVCVWGAYLDGSKTGGQFGCSADVTDHFRITVYGDAGGMPDDQNIIATRTILSANLTREEYPGTTYEWMYLDDTGEPMFAYRMSLATPITGLIPGNCHWLEIVNFTPAAEGDPPNTCEWHWAHATGNDYSFEGSYTSIDPAMPVYGFGGGRASDMAFCLDCGIEAGGCDAVARACCTCADAVPPSQCTIETLDACMDGVWDVGAADCIGYECATTAPSGDTCDEAIPITPGRYVFDTTCAETDGPGGPGAAWSVRKENGGLVGFGKEIWFKYNVTEGVYLLQFSTCAGGSGDDTYDGMIAVFHNNANPTACLCPGQTGFLQNGDGSDENCNGISDSGHGWLSRVASQGECWTIAVGGFEGDAGHGVLDFTAVNADDCDAPPPVAEPTVADVGFGTRVRYLAFQAAPESAGMPHAVRVKVTDVPAPFEYAEGRTMWIGEPRDVTEVAAKTDAGLPTFKLAELQCEPFYADWTEYGAVYVRSESFVPRGVYDVQAIGDDCSPLIEANYSDPLPVTLSKWGDVVGGDNLASPQGSVDFVDISSVVDKFKNLPAAPTKSRADVTPNLPDMIVDFEDIPAVVDAFRGRSYPYSGPPVDDPCL